MSTKTLVVVYEQDDDKRGEITIVENPQKAARVVETLLEAGFERDRIRIFTGGETCVEIQEDHLDELSDTASTAVIGNLDAAASFASIEIADTPAEAQVAEIRLDTTTTLALAMFVLILGILANMARWWWRNRKQRNIDLM